MGQHWKKHVQGATEAWVGGKALPKGDGESLPEEVLCKRGAGVYQVAKWKRKARPWSLTSSLDQAVESQPVTSHRVKGNPEKRAGRWIYHLSEVFGKGSGSYVRGMLQVSKHSCHTHWQGAPRTMWVTAEPCHPFSPGSTHAWRRQAGRSPTRFIFLLLSLSPPPNLSLLGK